MRHVAWGLDEEEHLPRPCLRIFVKVFLFLFVVADIVMCFFFVTRARRLCR